MRHSESPKSEPSDQSQGRLLALLTTSFYALFTLLPDSNSLMVSWPWVFIWQVALLTPMLWLLWQVWQQKQWQSLGLGLDWIVAIAILSLIISNLGAEFPNQARWYSWSALGFIAALYAVFYWIKSSENRLQLLVYQGYLNIAFIVVSLFLWTTQTFLPQMEVINNAKAVGVNLSFDFGNLESRNWAPIGHQNYVAGYLLLALPLLFALSLLESGKRRWLWITGLLLGLIDFYTTSSRGGWLGLLAFAIFALVGVFLQGQLPRRWLILGSLGTLGAIASVALLNNRINTAIIGLLQGNGNAELGYRLLNNVVGWRMGTSHLLTGIGLGGVPLLYQKYRPIWAGRDSEIIHQLHSTPAQLFAEMGLWGILIPLIGGVWLIYQLWRWLGQNKAELKQKNTEFILIWSLCGALLAYGVMSLTDYQLDNLCISGTLMIYGACLVSLLKSNANLVNENLSSSSPLTSIISILQNPKSKLAFCYGSLGLILAMIIWLTPIQRAWQLSSLGFNALSQKKLPAFVQLLTQAHELAPWESYYSYQLGWNLGNIGLMAPNQKIRTQFESESIKWFKKGIEASPYQEFAHTNLGWLELASNPSASAISFAQSLQLMPAKRGVFYGLGLSLLSQQKTELAIAAFSIECLRDPLFITSPFWRGPQLRSLYPLVLKQVESELNGIIKQLSTENSSNSPLLSTFHQIRGALYWWGGKLDKAQADLSQYGSPTSQALLAISLGKSPNLETLPRSVQLLLQAWQKPDQLATLLNQAWIEKNSTPLLEKLQQQLVDSMPRSPKNSLTNFDQWLKQNNIFLQYRRKRAGFGVVSRHIDGPQPEDFFLVVENLPINTWFEDVFPSPFYDPPFDLAIQPLREKVLKQVLP
jgi:tetratricopeptide (TPR) repeat protein